MNKIQYSLCKIMTLLFAWIFKWPSIPSFLISFLDVRKKWYSWDKWSSKISWQSYFIYHRNFFRGSVQDRLLGFSSWDGFTEYSQLLQTATVRKQENSLSCSIIMRLDNFSFEFACYAFINYSTVSFKHYQSLAIFMKICGKNGKTI